MLPRRLFLAAILAATAAAPAPAQAPAADAPKAKLKPGVRLAIVGDSITEQKLYSKYIADYLYATQPELNAHVVQFGWSGERAVGFAARLDNDLMPFKPDVVTLCYGMNDGSYQAYKPEIGAAFEKPTREAVEKLKKSGATVVVGAPGAVDQYFFRRKPDEKVSGFAAVYNENLNTLGGIARKIAADHGFPHADVHAAMMTAMLKAQAKLGDKYHVCGGDGFHPAQNGQLLMAYAFLKAMDLDGDLGTITVDFAGKSTAVNGHVLAKQSEGTVEVVSSRYPFCFSGDETQPAGTRSILPFVPFNEDLNRLTLKVTNAPAEKLNVTWGTETHAFTKAELEKGVNLATAFKDHPLAAGFARIDAAVAEQQQFQTMMIKQIITTHRAQRAAVNDAGFHTALDGIRDRLWMLEGEKHAKVRAARLPIGHTISVVPVK